MARYSKVDENALRERWRKGVKAPVAARELGYSVQAVYYRYRVLNLEAGLPVARSPRRDHSLSGHLLLGSVSEEAIADRNLRAALRPRSIAAALMGDPLPGYSALDRR